MSEEAPMRLPDPRVMLHIKGEGNEWRGLLPASKIGSMAALMAQFIREASAELQEPEYEI